MKGYINTIITNAFYLYSVQGLNLLIPILVLPYLIKTLSMESFGIYSFAFAFSQFIILFVDFGFNISVTKKIAESFEDKETIKRIYWDTTVLKIIFCIISLAIVLVILAAFPSIRVYSSGILYSYIMIIGTVLFPIWWFQGMNKMRELGIISLISKFLSYPLIFILVKKQDDHNLAIIIQSFSYFFAGLFSILFLYKYNNHYFKNVTVLKSIDYYVNELKDSFPIFLSNSSISLYTNSLTILLGIYSTQYNVGLFGAMERIVRMICFGILAPINQVCFPVIINLKKQNYFKAKQLFLTVVVGTLVLMMLIYAIYFIFRKEIILFLFENYVSYDIEALLNIFLTMILPISLGGVIGQLGLLALGGHREKILFSKIYIYVGIFSLPFTVLSIYFLELKGAIASMIFVESIIFLLFLIIYKNSLKKLSLLNY